MGIHILGISGTPIKDGNCDVLVQETLRATKELSNETLGEVETEFITLADKNIQLCTHCQHCVKNRSRCKIQDDAHWIHDRIGECDGLILGGPAWALDISPHLPILLTRGRPITFFNPDMFRNKVVGVVTVGFFGFGLEHAAESVTRAASARNMLPVARGYATASTAAFGERPAYLKNGVLDDEAGIRRVRNVAKRVVEITRMIKFATEAGIVVPQEERLTALGGKWRTPKGEVPEEKILVDGVWREKDKE